MNKIRFLSSRFLLLWLVAGATIIILSLLQGMDARLIALRQEQADVTLLTEILANVSHDNDLTNDTFPLGPATDTFVQRELLSLTRTHTAYIARQQGVITAVVLPAETLEGYNGPIELLIGINVEGEITGVRIVAHHETARLGDMIELGVSNWVLSFNNRSLANTDLLLWRVKKDGGEFDQFAGATITPRAVVGAVKKALEFFTANREVLLNVASNNSPVPATQNHSLASAGITAWLVAMMQPLPLLMLALLLALKNFLAPRQDPPAPSLPVGTEPGSKRVRVTGKS